MTPTFQHKMGGDEKVTIRAVEVDPLNRNRNVGKEGEIEVIPLLLSPAPHPHLIKAWCKFKFDGRGSKVGTDAELD